MTVEELVQRVRNLTNDYGEVGDIIATGIKTITTASDTAWSVDDADNFSEGDWAHVDWEVVEVTAVDTATDVLTVRRAQKGTTGAIHAVGAVVRANIKITKQQILEALNAALGGAYPLLFKVTEDTSLSTVNGQELYELADDHRDIRSIWIEANIGEGDYVLNRSYELIDHQNFALYGGWDTGYTIKVICIDGFTRMTAGGSLDTSFPDDDEAYDYLVKDAAGRLLHMLAAQEAVNNSDPARGTNEQDNRYVLLNVAKDMRKEATESLRKARRPLPKRILPRPDARYF